MPKYLLQANYVGDGVKGLLKEGGTNRRAAAEMGVQSLGGSIESFYYAFGETDAYVIADLPDNVSMAALALTISATGAVGVKTTVLITPEDLDAAVKKSPGYRGPGQ
ncbi:MAG: GYD domain-containing protein [Acidobacteriota bacterium]